MEEKQNESPEIWIKQNILGGSAFNNDFRSKYMARLGLINEAKSKIPSHHEELQKKRHSEESKSNNNSLNNSLVKEPSEQQMLNQSQQSTSISNNNSGIKEDKNLVVEKSFSHENIQLNFLTRTDDQIRQNYLNKLIKNNILKTQPSKKQQTIIIFDWDDTLLCTTFLGNLGFIDLPVEVNSQIKQLDISASNILAKSISYGDCYIVTNAAQGWVEQSSKLYFPKVNSILAQQKITVISARSGFEEIFPGDCHKWKVEAFKNIKKNYEENILTNLICLGDSHIEMDAAHSLAKLFNQTLIKTIKFRENPKPDELVKQQELVGDKFEQIYKNLRNLTIRLEKKANKDQN